MQIKLIKNKKYHTLINWVQKCYLVKVKNICIYILLYICIILYTNCITNYPVRKKNKLYICVDLKNPPYKKCMDSSQVTLEK